MTKNSTERLSVKKLDKFPPNNIGKVFMNVIIIATCLILVVYGMLEYNLWGW